MHVVVVFLVLFSAFAAEEKDWAEIYGKTPIASRCYEFEQVLTHLPHIAGSKEDFWTARYMKEMFEEFGLRNVFYDTHDFLLTYPITAALSMLAPVPFEAQFVEKEEVISEDPATGDSRVKMPFVGYSPSRDVTGSVVYVNYGREKDYVDVEKKNVTIKGKLVIARYGKMYRGAKVRLAQNRGAIGVILYSDPADDGYVRGKVFPEGPWRGAGSVQRGR